MRILFLSRWFPYPPNNGSRLRIYNLLKGLAKHHQVTLISFVEPEEQAPDMAALSTVCQSVMVVPRIRFNRRSSRALLGFLSATPRFVKDTFSSDMRDCIIETLQADAYGLVIASEFDMAVYSPYFQQLPAILEDLEIGVFYDRFKNATSLKQKIRHGLTWAKHRHYLTMLLRRFSYCTVVSELDKAILSEAIIYDGTIAVIPNGVDLAHYGQVAEDQKPHQLIFTGSFSYFANYEAMLWFLGKVYPLIQKQMPDISLIITGDHQNRTLPTEQNVTRSGLVDDVRPLIAQSHVGIVPLNVGGGTRLKILEAMALGVPVVATPKGAEGLAGEHGKHLLIAETPEAFAEAVIQLLSDPQLHQQITSQAHHLVKTMYDWEVILPQFLALTQRLNQTPTRKALTE